METNIIYNENCLETLLKMPDDFIDLILTSPPYDNLRDYKGYSFDLEPIAKEIYRVIKPGGIVVWIVGDATVDGSETGTSFKQALYFKEICGFRLHDTMIYEKNSPSYPASDNSIRYSSIFEYMFIFSKGKPNSTNLIKDRKNIWAGSSSFGKITSRQKNGELVKKQIVEIQDLSYRNNIWRFDTGYNLSTKDKEAFKHPAIFPEKLAADHIISWSNEGDLIYDPFMGSGTVGKMCIKTNRKFIGSEISEEYCVIANKRIEDEAKQGRLF